jgi:hypothetical protein
MSYMSAYYQKNREKLLSASKEYYHKNKKKEKTTDNWYINTRTKVKNLDNIPYKQPSLLVTFT